MSIEINCLYWVGDLDEDEQAILAALIKAGAVVKVERNA